ncbi:MAG: NIPSNAP family protein [Pseudolysinimonas sp.]
MIYELRVYTALPGRLPALLSRFENVTLGFWEKYGIHQVGFFTTTIGPNSNDLTYLLTWDSLADREQKWNAFQTDADWIAARKASEADGQIVSNIASSILTPTKFSALK